MAASPCAVTAPRPTACSWWPHDVMPPTVVSTERIARLAFRIEAVRIYAWNARPFTWDASWVSR